ncbi:MAG: diacylglycerol kinase family lipid kinase [Deltaproteobacteria bacterium]|nr:diacylglycerol kinase family lipid kinase [Deltaproteobacteria bacterium]
MSSPSQKTVFIVNPKAAMGSVRKTWSRIEALAHEQLGPFETLVTQEPGDATVFTRDSLLKGAETIICLGGDGTLNEIVNGFIERDRPIRPEAALGFIPQGSGCDFTRTVGIARKPERALELIKKRIVRPLDLGRLIYEDHGGNESIRFFHNVTSFGLGGEVDERVNRTSKALGGFISFIWATLVSLLIYDKKRIHLKVDDHFDDTIVTWNIIIGNGCYHGGGMLVAPEAKVDDGLFHITIVGDLTLPQVFLNLHRLYNGQILQVDKVMSTTGRHIEATSEQRVLLDVDGEQPGMLPVTVDMVPAAIPFITPG